MTKRILTAAGWGLGGLVVALGLTVGAFAIAGGDIADPASRPALVSPSTGDVAEERSPSPAAGGTETPSPTQDRDGGADDHGGNSGPGSGDSSGSGSGDNSGPGSGDSSGSGSGDSSGSGSGDSSGPGSGDSSGSGSGDSSGSGSGDRDDD